MHWLSEIQTEPNRVAPKESLLTQGRLSHRGSSPRTIRPPRLPCLVAITTEMRHCHAGIDQSIVHGCKPLCDQTKYIDIHCWHGQCVPMVQRAIVRSAEHHEIIRDTPQPPAHLELTHSQFETSPPLVDPKVWKHPPGTYVSPHLATQRPGS